MADTLSERISKKTPYGRAAMGLELPKKKPEEVALVEKQSVAHEAAEEKTLSKDVPRLKEYAVRKNISEKSPAEERLEQLQYQRATGKKYDEAKPAAKRSVGKSLPKRT